MVTAGAQGTVALYGLAAGMEVADALAPGFGRWARQCTWTAWAAHTATLGLAVVILGRDLLVGLFGAVLVFGWLAMSNSLAVAALLGRPVFGAVTVPLAFVALVAAGLVSGGLGRGGVPAAVLEAAWVPIHVVLALTGYAALAVAFATGILYLVMERALRKKTFGRHYRRLPPLLALDGWAHRLVALGFTLLVLAMVTGALGARAVWGRYWAWEAKETWTLVTVLIYGGYLLGRRLGAGRAHLRWVPRRAAWWSVMGFGAVLTNLFVINLLFGGLHRFGAGP